MKALAIAATNLRRMLRVRTNIFFVFVFPMLLIFILGLAFGGEEDPRVGLVAPTGGARAQELVADLRAAKGISVRLVDTEAQLTTLVEHGELAAGLVVPDDYDAAVRDGRPVALRYLARPGPDGLRLGPVVAAAVNRQSTRIQAARVAAGPLGIDLDESLRRSDAARASMALVTVDARNAGTRTDVAQLGRFDTGASSQLLLFLFVTALTSSIALIETRRLRVPTRMVATPTPVRTIILGEGLGRFTIAAVQSVFIMVGSALLFGVRWGDPLAAAALTTSFALVASGAGMLLGATARTPEQAIAFGMLFGIGLGAIGGTMMPLEFFSPTMRTVAHLTPHAWAVDGFAALLRRGGTVTAIVPQLAVLLGAATVLTALAAWRLRRSVAA
jgi:ABC-2 type transport system permease protein